MTPRRILPVAALVAAILIPAATADAKAPSCTRGGAKLEQADGDIRIVSRVLKKTSKFQTRKEGISACWVPTGKRIRIATEIDHGEDLLTSTSISILEGRYVGVNILYLGGISERTRALVFDAKKQAKLHDTKICEPDTDDHTGPEDVEFLQKGGMVFVCGALWMFRDAAQKTPTMLEPASALPVALAVSRRSMSYVDVIYWTTLDDGTAKSLSLVE
ncbi:MAG TPA: hypothetical protein VFN44_00565 [Solirubrobacteraceae bacterium]|nr:hypothetical protein [Solirubrobacteraceae bacterium]